MSFKSIYGRAFELLPEFAGANLGAVVFIATPLQFVVIVYNSND
jgi:hypothetical protein